MNDKIETSSNENNTSDVIMKAVMSFLAVFMPITLVKRVLSLVLIAAGIDNKMKLSILLDTKKSNYFYN